MPIELFDGVAITIEAALVTPVTTCGVWGSGSAADLSRWDSATWGPDELWQDISRHPYTGRPLLSALTIDRGFRSDVQRWDTGTATLSMLNPDGIFSAGSLVGPFVVSGVCGIRAMVPIRIAAARAGRIYPLYRGYAQDWARSYDPATGLPTVVVPCIDEWGRLADAGGIALTSAVGGGELFGPRCHRILDAGGHSGARAIDLGSVAMQATTLDSKTTDLLDRTADSEGGAIYVDADGTVVGERQYALVENARSVVVQAYFGDRPHQGEIPYVDAPLTSTAMQIKNVVSYARTGGVAQVRADASSRACIGDRTDPRSDLICTTDAQADLLAAWKLARYKDPEDRFAGVVLNPRHAAWGPKIWPQVLGRRVRDLVCVTRRPDDEPPIVRYGHVARIRHEITQDSWSTRLGMSSATPYMRFATSRWDTGTWGASDTDPTAAVWFY